MSASLSENSGAKTTSPKSRKTGIIAGGGTGGHIYPGIAIAKALQKLAPDMSIQFVGSPDGLETKIVPQEGYDLHLIKVPKLNYAGSLLPKLKQIWTLPLAFVRCFFLIFRLKPAFVLGVGGFASGPFTLAAALLKIPTAIWEPNAEPGLTNRWLSRFVKRAYVVFPEARQSLHAPELHEYGIPVRAAIAAMHRAAALPAAEPPFKILVFGGSQGARALNHCLMDLLKTYDLSQLGLEIVHQTGRLDFAKVQTAYAGRSGVRALEFLSPMEDYYGWADLIVCRAGASTVAEITAIGKPAIFVPLPSSADDHQRKNALSMVHKEAGILLLQSELTCDSLMKIILDLQQNPELRGKMGKNASLLYKDRAAENIAQELLSLR